MATEDRWPDSFEGQDTPTRRWPALAITVLVVIVVGWLARPGVVEPPELVVESPPVAPATAPSPSFTGTGPEVVAGSWGRPLAVTANPRTRPTVLWTGDRVLLFGGQPDPGDDTGLIIDPTTSAWTTMAPSPLGSRVGHTAVWTGEEMIVMEGAPVGQAAAVAAQEIDGAAYDPSDNTWRPIADAPVNPRTGHVALWTGEEMLVFGGSRTFETQVPIAAYDPAADTWRLGAPAPLDRSFGLVGAVWTGDEAVIWTGDGPNDVAAYDPATDTWRQLPPSPHGLRSVTATWTGTHLVLLGIPLPGSDIGGMALHLADERWTVLPPSPQSFAATHQSVWTGESVVLVGGPEEVPGVVWTPSTSRWALLPPAPQAALSGHAVVWIDSGLFMWGGQGADGPLGTSWIFAFE